MKIKRLRKIVIGDTTFKMKWDADDSGGHVKYPNEDEPGEIMVGTMIDATNPENTLSVLIHELTEAIHIDQRTRYIRPDTLDSYEFHYTHREHTVLCGRLAGLLNQFIV